MTNSIGEIEGSEVILVIGSNTTEAHPQVARRIYDAVDKGAKLIVIDPRATKLAQHAHIHLQLWPGTDIPLINAMMRIILDENLIDDVFIEMRTENFTELRDMLFRMDLAKALAITGVPHDLAAAAATTYASAHKAVLCYCLGITQHICGTDNVQTLANLAMLTGHVEQEFTGVDPLRGQNNVQGACDMGGLPGVFPGYQSVGDPIARAKFERAWGGIMPPKPGITLMEMTHHGLELGIKGMLIMAENPMLSDANIARVEKTLSGLEFLAVTEIFLTETARMAHVVFPAASFAEKTGTFTNTERRVQLVWKAIPPIGLCRPDSEIIAELSGRMGYEMDYESPAEIMEEIAMLVPIYGGIYHDRLEGGWGLQWPCPDRAHQGTQYLHKYSFTRGKGHFIPARHEPPAELPDEDYPLLLMTGRIYHHYHTGTMTRRCPTLRRESPEALLTINPADAKKINIRSGDMVRLFSRRGEISIRVQLNPEVRESTCYTTFHFFEAPVNLVTQDALDPIAKCPEYKVCAVRVGKIAGVNS